MAMTLQVLHEWSGVEGPLPPPRRLVGLLPAVAGIGPADLKSVWFSASAVDLRLCSEPLGLWHSLGGKAKLPTKPGPRPSLFHLGAFAQAASLSGSPFWPLTTCLTLIYHQASALYRQLFPLLSPFCTGWVALPCAPRCPTYRLP